MKRKIISDIRLYRSESQNEYGIYATESFADKKLNAIVERVVMKLRESEFSLGEFDHLYINFTSCAMADKMDLSNEVDRYHPWFRFCHIHINEDLYSKLGSPETWNEIVLCIKNVLITFFTSEDFDEKSITAEEIGVFYIEVENCTLPLLDFGELENDISIKGAVFRELLPRLESDDEGERKIAAMALKYALAALAGDEIN